MDYDTATSDNTAMGVAPASQPAASSSSDNSNNLSPLPEVTSLAIAAAQEAKGYDLLVLDISKVFSLSDQFLLISGRSDRHVQGIANKIRNSLADHGIKPYSVEGLDKGQWVLMDYGSLLIHVFYESEREKYSLERLWIGAKQLSIPDVDDSEAA